MLGTMVDSFKYIILFNLNNLQDCCYPSCTDEDIERERFSIFLGYIASKLGAYLSFLKFFLFPVFPLYYTAFVHF